MPMKTNSSITSDHWLKQAVKKLETAGIGTARLDSLVLIEDVVGKDRAWLLAHPETVLSDTQLHTLEGFIERRATHEPLAYILGQSEFYGRKFVVNKHVLEPRPESETMIDCLKSLVLPKTPRLADIGSGSGAIGLTAALEIPGSTIDLYDIDLQTLKVARANCKLHKVTARLYQADLLTKPHDDYHVVLANLPYVPDNYQINQAVLSEPKIAIYGGNDGLDLYRRLFYQLDNLRNKPHFVLTESLPFQHQALEKIAKQSSYDLQKTDDFIQVLAYAN